MKTGRQIFEEVVGMINNVIEIKEIISQDLTSVSFKACSIKWLRNGSYFTLQGDLERYTVTSISNGIIGASKPNSTVLEKRTKLEIQKPTFVSGTPTNLEGEIGLSEKAGQEVNLPYVWLLETIKGRGSNRLSSIGKTFDYTFYCLDQSDITDWLNADRHNFGVVPMTQLADAVIEAFEENYGTNVVGDFGVKEFNLFGRETQSGFEAYVLSKKLSGVEYTPTISVSREACEC